MYRHWHMLRRIPRYPVKITTSQLKQSLGNQGFEITARALQRDLQELSQIFPLVVDEREKPFGWSWQRDARSFDLPGMTIPEALTWAMAEQHQKTMIDHKSSQLSPEIWPDLAMQYSGQLSTYAETVERVTGKHVLEKWLYLPVEAGAVCFE